MSREGGVVPSETDRGRRTLAATDGRQGRDRGVVRAHLGLLEKWFELA